MEPLKVFHSYDKDLVTIKRGFLIFMILFFLAVCVGAYWMVNEIKEAQKSVVVIDSNNASFIGEREILTRERRQGQLKRHVETFLKEFWNVSQEQEIMEASVNRALMLADESGLKLYEHYYEIEGLGNWLMKHSANSIIVIEEIVIDMSTYPYQGYVIAINELESAAAYSKRNMNMTFSIRDYPVSYDNVAGAMLMNIEVKDDKMIEDDKN